MIQSIPVQKSLCITLVYSLFAEVGLEHGTYVLLQAAVGQKVCTIAESIFLERTLIHLDPKHPPSHSWSTLIALLTLLQRVIKRIRFNPFNVST